MTDTKHPADVLADKCELIGSNPALWSQQAATMLRALPALEAERDAAKKALALVQQHHTTAWNRGHEAGMRAARDQITKARNAVKADAWGNAKLTDALMAVEAERDALRAELAAMKAQAAQPVAWMDDFGNAFPLAANKGAGSWLDANKRKWKPLYTTPQAEQRSHRSDADWFSLVMNAAAEIENAANCLRDPDAKRNAEGAAKHYREAANNRWAAPQAAQPLTFAEVMGEMGIGKEGGAA